MRLLDSARYDIMPAVRHTAASYCADLDLSEA
jgi:hypothetical protein